MNHESKRLFFESTAARRMRPTSRPQRAFSVDSSRWFNKRTRRDHSDAPDRGNSNVPDKVSNAPDKVNSNVPGKDSVQDKANGPDGWMERVAAGQA